ncbi:hypothetical protein CDD80_6865 [Ophiocordyceps camponoti-rufipedis]|uniref:Chromo domain-containing protein n=1 Tax=Ophiocordyceps camponoti-rufipedis TaxID=2004952 RepID=A0A2C5YID3_9HYPO|nr:hypothetical protein CDD80_6865 [Ophiocordyceps camponoti-rufipedis]
MAPTPSAQLRPRREKPAEARIVVPLPSRPAAYQPGSGPPLQRIRLMPPRDTTAFIVDRILLPSPGLAANGKPLPKRMTYIVGWTDLPAARLLVPAMEVLEYVSPRALEEWESEMEAELDEDRRMMVKEQEVAASQGKTDKKARPPAHTDIEPAAVAEPETEEQARHKVTAMSLSTPKKARLEDFEGFTDYEDGSPSRQLARESAWQEQNEQVVSDVQGEYLLADDGWRMNSDGLDGNVPLRFKEIPDSFSSEALDLSQTVVNPGGFTPFNQNRRLLSMSEMMGQSGGLQETPTTQEPAKKQAKARKKSTSSAQKKKKTASAPPVDENGEKVWVVKRIDNMQLYEVEGRGVVRYFEVLWEGDWPKDQNPTWEPEDHLPPNLRGFCWRGR